MRASRTGATWWVFLPSRLQAPCAWRCRSSGRSRASEHRVPRRKCGAQRSAIGRPKVRKLPFVHDPQLDGSFVPRGGHFHDADIAGDPLDALLVDLGADVVQHGSLDDVGTEGRKRHRHEAAARCSDEDGAADTGRAHQVERVHHFVDRCVVGPVIAIVGTAAAAEVGAEYPVASGQMPGQRFEVLRVAGEAGRGR